MQDGHVPCTCSVLVRRSAIDVVGGFEERFHLYEDQSLWAKLFLRYPVFVTPECLSRYRQHPGSVSAAANQQGLYDRMARHPARAAFLDWLAAHVADGNLRDAGVERALRLARAPYIEPASTRVRIDRVKLKLLLRLGKYRRRLARRFARLRAAARLSA